MRGDGERKEGWRHEGVRFIKKSRVNFQRREVKITKWQRSIRNIDNHDEMRR